MTTRNQPPSPMGHVLFVEPPTRCPYLGPDAMDGKVQRTSRWFDAYDALVSNPPPCGALVCGKTLGDRGTGMLRGLAKHGFGRPTIVCCAHEPRRSIQKAWSLPRDDVEIITAVDQLVPAVHSLLDRCVSRQVADYLIRRLRPRDPVARKMIRLLAAGGDMLLATSGEVAKRLEVGRSTLYRTLENDSLPGVAHWQMFFRLLGAAKVLQQGGTAADAAFRAGLSDVAGLRKASARHLGLSTSELRGLTRWTSVADYWVQREAIANRS